MHATPKIEKIRTGSFMSPGLDRLLTALHQRHGGHVLREPRRLDARARLSRRLGSRPGTPHISNRNLLYRDRRAGASRSSRASASSVALV